MVSNDSTLLLYLGELVTSDAFDRVCKSLYQLLKLNRFYLQFKCGQYADKHLIAKATMVLDISSDLLKCRSCRKNSVNASSIRSRIGVLSKSMKASGLNKTDDKCPVQKSYFGAEQGISIIRSLKAILKASLDCRFINVSA